MTTIAWDGVSLAADRQVSCGSGVWRNMCKIRQVKGGHIACAGTHSQGSQLVQWIEDGMPKDAPSLDDCEAIMVNGSEITWFDGTAQTVIEPGEKLAIGSGWQYAIAAMDHGKNAHDAVAYAATRDNGTGGGVDNVTPRRKRR